MTMMKAMMMRKKIRMEVNDSEGDVDNDDGDDEKK